VITRAGPEDWQVYRRVRFAALAEAPYAFSSTLERERNYADDAWRQRLGSITAATFLAWQDSEPVGAATGKVEDPADEHAIPESWQLVGMWVDPRARGLGVADALVETVAGYAASQGAEALVLWVTEINDRATRFYERMGFRPTGVRQVVRPDEPDHWEQQMIRRPI
jgi:ribosomal protein S18 acetylase RimI-like enzyme